jgi:F-type H+-transporting ATPase subunit delta
MAEVRTIARPYAEAVFQLAKAKGELSAWSDMLQLAAAVASDQRIRALIGDPKFLPRRLGELILEICGGKLDDEGRNFILLLAENGRVEILPEVSELFEELRARYEGVLDANIISAFAMSEAQLKDLVNDLEARFKKKIEPRVSIDPELIGGVKVEMGDKVLDVSIRGKLEAMAVALKS